MEHLQHVIDLILREALVMFILLHVIWLKFIVKHFVLATMDFYVSLSTFDLSISINFNK